MKISTKLALFYVSVLAVFVLLSVGLVSVLRSVTSGYDAVLRAPVHQIEEARVVQVNFKKQVQEWKDVLLRGHDPKDLDTYSTQFHDQEQRVRTGAAALLDQVNDPEAARLLEQFLAAHQALSQKYQQAYEAYVTGHADFKAADRIVRGQDRAPTDLFDKVVARLQTVVQDSIQSQTEAARRARNRALALAAALLAAIGMAGFILVRDIVGRLSRLRAVSDRLALADISGLTIDINGNDEIAAFGKSMKGVHAAIEELLEHAATESTTTR